MTPESMADSRKLNRRHAKEKPADPRQAPRRSFPVRGAKRCTARATFIASAPRASARCDAPAGRVASRSNGDMATGVSIITEGLGDEAPVAPSRADRDAVPRPFGKSRRIRTVWAGVGWSFAE